MNSKKQFCLIGEKLSHSYSALLHKEFQAYSYELREIAADKLESFVKDNSYDGFNVTIPYKKAVMPYLDVIDETAQEAGAVNTVVRKNGYLYGYNTDVEGMAYLADKCGIVLQNKKVVILGGGGTSETAQALCRLKGAKEYMVVSRKGSITYDDIDRYRDADVLINTTPVGMYPKNGETVIDLSLFYRLESVIDVIYNPLMTNLLFDAREKGLKYASGLLMLVAQAKYARDLFTGETAEDSLIDQTYRKLLFDTVNIVLIGMPSSGKTTVGKLLAEMTGKTFVDTDSVIEEKAGKSVADIFHTQGESMFRALEAEAVCEAGKGKGQVIATGGGVIKNPGAYRALKQNGMIVHLVRDLEKTDTTGRPLLKEKDAVMKLFYERMPIYRAFSDITVENNGEAYETAIKIKELLYENISH